MNKPLRWGILGLGKISQKSMLPAFKFTQFAHCSALASRDLGKAQKVAQECPSQPLALHYEDLLTSESVDAIYIALPNHLHAEWAIKALKAGKHVLCEKPMAMSLKELEHIKVAVEQTGLICAEAFMYRHHPQHASIKNLIASGAIGSLHHFRAHFSYFLDDLSNIRSRPECGGGAWMDVGCYGVDSARYIIGEEPLSWNLMSHIDPKSGVDDSSCCQMEFPSGILAHIYCSTKTTREHCYEVSGTRGKLEVREAFIPAGGKTSNIVLTNDEGQKVIKHQGVNQYALELDHFAACVKQGRLLAPMENGELNGRILFHRHPYFRPD